MLTEPVQPKAQRPTGGARRALRAATLVALLGLPSLAAPLTGHAATVADARCAAPTTLDGYGRYRIAQTFTAKHTGRLTQATVFAHSPSPTNTDDYLIEIRETTPSGKPGKRALASTQINDIVRPAPGQTTTVTADFSPGARVAKGTRYALVITGVGGASPSVRSNRSAAHPAPNCPGALFDDNDLNNKFIKDTSTDIVFDTVVTTK